MKIGVIGSGVVAQALGAGFLKHGHEVVLGTRDTVKLKDWTAQNAKGRVEDVETAARFGEVLVLAVKGSAAVDALRSAGLANLAGKVVIDTTNPIAPAPPVNGVLKYFTTLDDSLLERLQKNYPDARLVKAFNSVGSASMVDPTFKGGKPTMFICGNDEAARNTVTGILDQFGWETSDLGKAESARAIEPLCMLWCIPGFLRNDWVHAYKVLS